MIIQSDASLNGLRCALIQDEKPVCHASRSLTNAETRYSNIERELLAAIWSLEHFNHYIEGSHVVIQTDHKPLVGIWNKSIHTASHRMQRLLLRMNRHSVTLGYIKGKTNVIANALSKNTIPAIHITVHIQEDISIIEVLCSTARIPTTGIQHIRDETTKDNTQQKLTRTIVEGWLEVRKDCTTQLHDYWSFRDELSVQNQLLFKGDRVVIPKTLQPEILRRLHEGHMVIEKMLLAQLYFGQD